MVCLWKLRNVYYVAGLYLSFTMWAPFDIYHGMIEGVDA